MNFPHQCRQHHQQQRQPCHKSANHRHSQGLLHLCSHSPSQSKRHQGKDSSDSSHQFGTYAQSDSVINRFFHRTSSPPVHPVLPYREYGILRQDAHNHDDARIAADIQWHAGNPQASRQPQIPVNDTVSTASDNRHSRSRNMSTAKTSRVARLRIIASS